MSARFYACASAMRQYVAFFLHYPMAIMLLVKLSQGEKVMILHFLKNLNLKHGVALCLPIFAAPIYMPALADHPTPAFGTEASGPINTISAAPLAQGQWAVGLRTEIISTNTFSNEELESLAARGIVGVHSIDRLSSTSLALAYGASADLTLSLRLPYVTRNNIREGEIEDGVPEVHIKGDAAGIGDAAFFGQYRFFNHDSTDASILFGVKTPTGKTNVANQDARLDAELQPGSGSWDALAGMALSRRHGRIGYHTNVLYAKTTEGSQDTDIGDAFFYNAALSYRLSNSKPDHPHSGDATVHGHLIWDVLFEINGETRGKTKVAGNSEPHSGGSTIYLAPGIRLSSSSWTGFLSLGIPVLENLNGVQTEVDYRVAGGMSFTF